MSFVPDEKISLNELRRISVPLYGMQQWGDLFTTRQRLTLGRIASLIGKQCNTSCATRFLALNFSKMVDMNNALATWQPHAEIPAHMFTRNAIPMKWDFAEAVPLSESSGTLQSAIKRSTDPLSVLAVIDSAGSVQRIDAVASTLSDQTASVWFTDPPYYDAVPYSHLSDFFYVWLRRALAGEPRELFGSNDVLKDAEIVVDRPHSASTSKKDVAFYEAGMARAFTEGRRPPSPGLSRPTEPPAHGSSRTGRPRRVEAQRHGSPWRGTIPRPFTLTPARQSAILAGRPPPRGAAPRPPEGGSYAVFMARAGPTMGGGGVTLDPLGARASDMAPPCYRFRGSLLSIFLLPVMGNQCTLFGR